MRFWKTIFAGGLFLLPALFASSVCANNLTITNVSLTNVSNGMADIEFDMQWDNSWRTSWQDNGNTITVTNWDAVWVFGKFRQSGGLWRHALLTTNGHTATGGTTNEIASNGSTNLGAFVYRVEEGSGTVTCETMRLRWNFAESGLAGTTEVDVAVFGVEMVYIPEGPFHLGSGGAEVNHFYRYPTTTETFVVSNESEIAVGAETGALYYTAGGDLNGPVSNAFPKGFQAFYCMKYEITQGQYTDFLLMLDPGIANTYYPNGYGQTRHTILFTNDTYTVDAPDRACNYLHGNMILTYLDWSGLRPMTELEFEKAARGVRTPWLNEYVWGDTSYVLLTNVAGVDGSGMETATPTNANIHHHPYPAVAGPVRVGIFATTSSSRERSGAGYWGNMELAGNLWDMTVSCARPEGRAFTAANGDGNEYTPWASIWPPLNNRAYTMRGGSYADQLGYIFRGQTSDRSHGDSSGLYNAQDPSRGARGARTAP